MLGSLVSIFGLILIIFAVIVFYYAPEAELGPGPAWIVLALVGIVCIFLGGGLNQLQEWLNSLFST